MSESMVIIMSAGEGKRMKSKTAKVLNKVCFRPMIDYVITAAKEVSSEKPVVIIGHKGEDIKSYLGDTVSYALQQQQLGTGHAVMQAADLIRKENPEVTIVLNGDMPLITGKTLAQGLAFHKQHHFHATVAGATYECPDGYGRLVIENGILEKIVEHKDADQSQRAIKQINSGIYFFDTKMLLDALSRLTNQNAQGEYYLTDTIEAIKSAGGKTGAFLVEDQNEVFGCNNRMELAHADLLMRRRINNTFMEQGVTIIDPDTTYIQDSVSIGQDTTIYPSTMLEGETVIGESCLIYPGCHIKNCRIGNNVSIQSSTLMDSQVGNDTTVGPYAYVRPMSSIGNHVKIGDFVEIKKSTIGDGTKISHLTYVGDSKVGKNVNFGCGTVTVNYDGKNKYLTEIEDDAFIGCNTNLVSPVKVGKGAFIAAGSTITDPVPENGFAIARQRQVNKENWIKPKDKTK